MCDIEKMEKENQIILYQPNSTVAIEVRVEQETVWLNRNQIALLFDRDVKTIGKHINNSLHEELDGLPTVAKFATVQKEGKRTVSRYIDYYNLDVVISVGYRVKSQNGILFRQWANKVLKEYILRGYAMNQRFERLEYRMAKTDYHIGASFKDLGKKLFAFSKMEILTGQELLERLDNE